MAGRKIEGQRACRESRLVDRRHLLGGAAAGLSMWGLVPRLAARPGRDPRLLVVVLRGGLDGLSLAAPVGDPSYAALRGRIALGAPGSGDGAGLALDGMFALNPAMPTLHDLYRRGQALIAHAVATPYRGRSHFDGQDVLESGMPGIGRFDDGWLNRALAALPASDRIDHRGLVMSSVVPLIMAGRAPVLSWAPKAYDLPTRLDTIQRVQELYEASDPELARAFAEGIAIDALASETGPVGPVQRTGVRHREFIETAEAAARFMSEPNGPRIGVLVYNGWDTHANEGAVKGQLANRLGGLDAAIRAYWTGMGEAWRDCVVTVVTEFGRTARANGTDGTDHGTGMAAIVLGGRVAGGRVVADWPGLTDAALYEGRDLAPTRDLRSLLKGVLADHLEVSPRALAGAVFPESASVEIARDLLHS